MTSTIPLTDSENSSGNIPIDVPDFVIRYAPLIYLYSTDPYLPSDIGEQLKNTVPKIGLLPLPDNANLPPLTLDNLSILNNFGGGGKNVYLTSKDVSKSPAWLYGITPDSDGVVPNAKTCVVITVDKGNGILDAFFVMFWAYNWGGTVLGQNLGNHVGDWEHVMVRFQYGVPKLVWLSQHASGQAFKYELLANRYNFGPRPVAFSANGSHAMYAIEGVHDHTIPSEHHSKPGLINDHTDKGKLYDPAQSAYWYKWTPSVAGSDLKWGTFTPYDPSYPVEYLNYFGRWGDAKYPKSDPRQHNLLFGLLSKEEDGPTGPGDKDIGRKEVWSGSNHQIWDKLGP